MFAIDWIRLVDGQPAKGDGSQLDDFYGRGETIYSATDGRVVQVRHDMPEAPLEQSGGGNDTVKASRDYGGNRHRSGHGRRALRHLVRHLDPPWVDDHLANDAEAVRQWQGDDLDLSEPLTSAAIVAAAPAEPRIATHLGDYVAMTELPDSLAPAEPMAGVL
jgi:hypothetical protein